MGQERPRNLGRGQIGLWQQSVPLPLAISIFAYDAHKGSNGDVIFDCVTWIFRVLCGCKGTWWRREQSGWYSGHAAECESRINSSGDCQSSWRVLYGITSLWWVWEEQSQRVDRRKNPNEQCLLEHHYYHLRSFPASVFLLSACELLPISTSVVKNLLVQPD